MDDRVVWPLVGREDELRFISSVLSERPGSAGVVLSGDLGVGKSRLLQATVDRALAAGRRAELVVGTEAAAAVPFGALSGLIPPTSAARATPFRAIARRLRARPGAPRPVLAIDDAHLLDAGSAALVHQLCLRGLAMVVATTRCGAPAPDAVVALWKDGLAARLEIGVLSTAAIDELIDHALPGAVCAGTRRRLHNLTAGSPRWLHELLTCCREAGALRCRDGTWRWPGPMPPGGRLGELLNARLAACGQAGRGIAELVACGGSVSLAMIESDDGLDEIDAAGLLDVSRDGQRVSVRLTPSLVGEVLLANTRPVRVRAAYRELITRLRATPMRRHDDRLNLAAWQLAAGQSGDADLTVAAARLAVGRRDLVLAERLARRAADAGHPDGTPLLLQVLHWEGRHGDAANLLARISDRPTLGRARNLYWGQARRDEAGAVLRTKDDSVDLTAADAMRLLFEARLEAAIDAALSVLRTEAAIDSRLWAYVAAVSAYGMLGRTEAALQQAGRGLAVAADHAGEGLFAEPHLRIARVQALMQAGRFGDAAAGAEQGYAEAIATPDRGLRGAWAGVRGSVAKLRGDLGLAETSLREAVCCAEDTDPNRFLRLYLMTLAGALAMSGRPTEARACAERSDALEPEVFPVHRPQIGLNRAWVLSAIGDIRGAEEAGLRAAADARSGGQITLEAIALYDVARRGSPAGIRQRLAELAGQSDGELVATYAMSAAALAGHDAERLDRVAAEFVRLDAPLLAAESAAAASGAYRRSHQPGRAALAAERARTLSLASRDADTPALRIADSTDVLTTREREIASLAAGARTSRQIADQLGITVRTVDNHLSRVYHKLGVSGRHDLAGLLAGHEPRG